MPTRYAPDTSFDAQTADLMRQAFEAAWHQLIDSGDANTLDVRADWARETLALRIVETTKTGERDVNRLRDDAIEHLANAVMPERS